MLALIVFGMEDKLEPIGPVGYNCPNCGYSPTTLCWAERKATVYWIPLFGMGKSYAIACDNCGYQEKIDDQLGQQLEQNIGTSATVEPAAVAGAAPEPATAYNPVTPSYQDDRPTTVLGQAPSSLGQQTTYLGPVSGAAPAPEPRGNQSAVPPGQPARCSNCGATVPSGSRFCQNCGATVGQMVAATIQTCPNCGHQQPEGRFCNNCGTTLRAG